MDVTGNIGETKKRILGALSNKSKTVTDLSNELGLAQSTVSEHIQSLLASGAIMQADDVKRKWTYYKVNPAYAQTNKAFTQKFSYLLFGVIVVALIGAAAFYLSSTSTPKLTCTPLSGLSCTHISRTSSGQLSMVIGGFVSPTQIEGSGCSYNSSEPSSFAPLNISLQAGQFTYLNVTCPSVLPSGTKAINIWVKTVTNGTAATQQVASIGIGVPATTTVTTTISTTTVAPVSSSSTTSIAQISTTVPQTISIAPITTSTGSVSTTSVTSTSITSTTITTRSTSISTTTIQPPGGCNSTTVLSTNQTDTCGIFSVQVTNFGSSIFSNYANISLFINSKFNYSLPAFSGTSTSELHLAGDLLTMETSNLSLSTNTVNVLMSVQITPLDPNSGCKTLTIAYLFDNDSCNNVYAKLTNLILSNASGITTAYFTIYSSFAGGYVINNTVGLTPGIIYTVVLGNKIIRLNINQTVDNIYDPSQRYAKISLNATPFDLQGGCGNLTLLYFSSNDTCGQFKVNLDDLTQAGAAVLSVYANGAMFNFTPVLNVGKTQLFDANGQTLNVSVNSTNTGTFPSWRWALMEMHINPSYTVLPVQTACNQTALLYLNYSDSCSPFYVRFQAIDLPNSTGASQAVLGIYYNGVQINTTSLYPGQSQTFTASSHSFKVYVNQTTYGLYVGQRWAKVTIT